MVFSTLHEEGGRLRLAIEKIAMPIQITFTKLEG